MRTRVAATVVGLLLSTFLVVSASDARFTAATANTANAASADQIAAPTGVSAGASAVACRITVTWTMTTTTWVTGYKVYRGGSTAGPFNLVGTALGRTTQSYSDESASLKAAIDYYYQVRAYYGNWLSPWSNAANATGPLVCGGGGA